MIFRMVNGLGIIKKGWFWKKVIFWMEIGKENGKFMIQQEDWTW